MPSLRRRATPRAPFGDVAHAIDEFLALEHGNDWFAELLALLLADESGVAHAAIVPVVDGECLMFLAWGPKATAVAKMERIVAPLR